MGVIKKTSIIVFFVLFLVSVVSAREPVNLNQFDTCPTQLNVCVADRNTFYGENVNLSLLITNLTNERDYYKKLYEDIPAENLTMRKLDFLNTQITNNYYNTNKTIYDLKAEINNISITQNYFIFTVAIIFLIDIIFRLFNLDIKKLKLLFNFRKTETSFNHSETYNTKIQNNYIKKDNKTNN